MKRTSFSPAAIVLLLAGSVALFAMSVLLHAYDTDPVATGEKSRPGSYSISAIGYAGFYDMLRRLDWPVGRSVGNTLSLVGSNGTLIVAEPNLAHVSSADGVKLMSAPRLLLVLPKWRGTQDAGRPSWISKADPVALNAARATLNLIAGNSDVLRAEWPGQWLENELPFTPTGTGVVQLIRSRELRPVIGTSEGMLVGELVERGKVVWVLADPDVMANHGIGKGDNALFMTALLDTLRRQNNIDPGAPVIFDETVHGFIEAEGSPIKLMFRFPFVVVTALAVIAAGLLALAATSRFGAPRTPTPELDFGKRNLIGNGARLLDYAGHHALVLRRYVRMTVRSVAQSLHAPPGMDEAELAAWLDRIGKARGVSHSCAAILHYVTTLDTGDAKNLTRLFESARDIHLWKGEILNGPVSRRRHRQ